MTARESIENLWDRGGVDIRALLDQVEADAVYGALKALANDWTSHCPDHSDTDEVSVDCRCDNANELRMRAEGVREDAVARRERAQAHAEGEHCFCGPECGWVRENERGDAE